MMGPIRTNRGIIMARLTDMLGLISKLQSPKITVHQERCVRVRNGNADCLRCAQACTAGCIAYDGESLTVSPERCIGCGTCATVCPTCALEAHHPGDAALLAACQQAGALMEGVVPIGCGQLLDQAADRYDEEKIVRVECLGRVDESLLTFCATQGACEVTLIHGDCASCAYGTGRACVEEVCATEQVLMEAWRTPLKLRLTTKLPAAAKRLQGADHDAGRRALFAEGGRQAARAGALVVEEALADALGEQGGEEAPLPRYTKVMDDGTLPHFVPDRRERLLDFLADLGEPADVMVDTRLWGHVIIDTERCLSCQMCATFCPTAALTKFEEPDGTMGVDHRPADCVKCRTCEAICPADAIEISEEVFARDLMAGVTDRYVMKGRPIKHGTPHTIWRTAQTMMATDQVYER